MDQSHKDKTQFYAFLKETYPLLFPSDKLYPINMWGIECESGWDHLIKGVCIHLYAAYNSFNCTLELYRNTKRNSQYNDYFTPEKVDKLIEEYSQKVEEEKQNLPKFAQIKEKFGTLRIYVDNISDYARGVIDVAEYLSAITCEYCGEKGKTYRTGWHQTLCTKHATEKYGHDWYLKQTNLSDEEN